jgi:hypothetical protein
MGIDLQDGVILMVISGKKHKILIRIPWIKSYDLGPIAIPFITLISFKVSFVNRKYSGLQIFIQQGGAVLFW